jgi:Glycosyl transferase family 2
VTRKRGNSADNDEADGTPASDDALVTPEAAAAVTPVDDSPPAKARSRRAPRRRDGGSEPLTEATTKAPGTRSRQRVAVVIPAKDESRRIAATVRAARAIPRVDLVLVVDDGSEDSTQHVARDAGAVVVRHSHNRGKAAAMETGAAVVAMRDTPDRPPRLLLFIDGDLGESAVNTAPLVPPVLEGSADFSIALLPPQVGAGGRGIVVGAARRAIAAMTGWTPTQPLSGMRCLTREAFEAATPLARGWGVETGMTIDLLRQGFTAVEVPCELRHRPSGSDLRGQLHRAAQYRDVQLAVNARRVRRAAGALRSTLTPGASPPTTHR